MGLKLANEVDQYIKESCPGAQLGRLTIIGYSLGGLIVRAALPHLEKYKSKMHGFLTLCSPHLGYMYNSSKITNMGIWFIQKLKKCESI
jgi:alpha-beta hydrolase superfamily lysophospholipase